MTCRLYSKEYGPGVGEHCNMLGNASWTSRCRTTKTRMMSLRQKIRSNVRRMIDLSCLLELSLVAGFRTTLSCHAPSMTCQSVNVRRMILTLVNLWICLKSWNFGRSVLFCPLDQLYLSGGSRGRVVLHCLISLGASSSERFGLHAVHEALGIRIGNSNDLAMAFVIVYKLSKFCS